MVFFIDNIHLRKGHAIDIDGTTRLITIFSIKSTFLLFVVFHARILSQTSEIKKNLYPPYLEILRKTTLKTTHIAHHVSKRFWDVPETPETVRNVSETSLEQSVL